eukprot:m.295072 g.295072  ORF g.295072 m.295072 type:complete len:140 (-) comp19510_c0_seq10:28-447(-)
MYRFERNLEFLHTKAGSSRSTIRQYSVNASARATAIETLLFNHTTAQWHDLHIPSKTQVTDHNASASNFIPLWAGLPQHKDAIDAVVRAFEHSGLLQAGGVLTTASTTGQQVGVNVFARLLCECERLCLRALGAYVLVK